MGILDDLRVDIGDDGGVIPSGSPLAPTLGLPIGANRTILTDLRIDIGDDEGIIPSGSLAGGIPVHNLLSPQHGDTVSYTPPLDGDLILGLSSNVWGVLPRGNDQERLTVISGAVTWAPLSTAGSGFGDVFGPGSSTDNAIVRYDGTTGKIIQDSLVIIDDSGNLSTPGGAELGGKLNLNSSICYSCRNFTGVGNITVGDDDTIVAVNKAVGAPTTVFLPTSTDEGRVIIVKDKRGDANTNNILVTPTSGLIDGLLGFRITQNYQSVTFAFCAGSWSII